MSLYTMTVRWSQENARFVDGRYSRAHVWEFDGGTVVPASSSPHVVPVPQSDPSAVDPEEAFVAALASCHMLWFLSIAAKRGFCVRAYRDQAEGTMAAGRDGRLRMTTVTLRPHVTFTSAKLPTEDVVREMHEAAHHECFLASSVTTELSTAPTFEVLP